jgi:hypothetical protein
MRASLGGTTFEALRADSKPGGEVPQARDDLKRA